MISEVLQEIFSVLFFTVNASPTIPISPNTPLPPKKKENLNKTLFKQFTVLSITWEKKSK